MRANSHNVQRIRGSEDVAKSRVGKKCAVWSGVTKIELADATETETSDFEIKKSKNLKI